MCNSSGVEEEHLEEHVLPEDDGNWTDEDSDDSYDEDEDDDSYVHGYPDYANRKSLVLKNSLLALLRVNKAVRNEASEVFWGCNTFTFDSTDALGDTMVALPYYALKLIHSVEVMIDLFDDPAFREDLDEGDYTISELDGIVTLEGACTQLACLEVTPKLKELYVAIGMESCKLQKKLGRALSILLPDLPQARTIVELIACDHCEASEFSNKSTVSTPLQY